MRVWCVVVVEAWLGNLKLLPHVTQPPGVAARALRRYKAPAASSLSLRNDFSMHEKNNEHNERSED